MQSGAELKPESSVTHLRGVGPERARLLQKLGIASVLDLLLHAPRRHEDRRAFRKISEVAAGETVCLEGEVVEAGVKRFGRGTKSLSLVVIDDGSARLHCRWWNMPHIASGFARGQHLLVTGRVRQVKPRTIDHPEIESVEAGEEESIHTRRIVPIYPLTEGVSQRWIRSLVWRALETNLPEKYPADFFLGRPGFAEAIRKLHFPGELFEVGAARERLALEEFIGLQIEIQTRRKNLESKAPRVHCPGDNHLIKKLLPSLGYSLTAAQTRVLREIRQDLTRGIPMRRLLQGDVGSGKTAVAACCALMAVESGFNVALMVPTEILAEQHLKNFSRWFGPLNVPVKIWTGSSKSDLHGNEFPAARNSEGMLVIGTHALFQKSFEISRLGLIIIDEQHRFGVAQREQLVRKGVFPHLLVMTATPIPRTLGLTVYGDLDSSVLDELPPGRAPIQTFVRGEERLPKVWEFVREHLRRGEQAYIVYARVENESTGKAVLKEVEKVREALAPFRVEALHGKMSAEEKEAVMAGFAANAIQVLVASSVIEVGVDVPNATIIVIENAEQFGLAQLHQLRGRVGRGRRESFCILISPAKNQASAERLKIMEQTADGFKIAEADLKFRGPGELLGQDQSGLPKFRFGNLETDFELVIEARRIAGQVLRKKDGEAQARSAERGNYEQM